MPCRRAIQSTGYRPSQWDYALSNKATGGSITTGDLVKDVYGLAAQVLNRLPDDKREAAIKTTVDFLGARTELKDTREEVDTLLRAEMHRLSHENPWYKVNPAMQTAPQYAKELPAVSTDRKIERVNGKISRGIVKNPAIQPTSLMQQTERNDGAAPTLS